MPTERRGDSTQRVGAVCSAVLRNGARVSLLALLLLQPQYLTRLAPRCLTGRLSYGRETDRLICRCGAGSYYSQLLQLLQPVETTSYDDDDAADRSAPGPPGPRQILFIPLLTS